MTVLDTATAEDALQTGIPVQIEIPQRVAEPWRPSFLALAAAAAGIFLFLLYHLQFAPLVLRFEHGLQRRIYGERSFEAHRQPKPRGEVLGPH